MRADPPLPLVFTTAQAISRGVTRHQVASRARSGRWTRLRHGVFCAAQAWARADRRERHALQAMAAVLSRSEAGVVSHLSAATLYGWPLPLGDLGEVSLTAATTEEATRRLDGLVVQVAGLSPSDVRRRRGVDVTSPARTVADCLRHLRTADAVAIADHALANGEVDPAQLLDVVRRQELWPYAAAAARALPLVDARRESWLESWSFVRLWEVGIPLPEPQVEVFDDDGRFVARVDGVWRRYGTVCEADGRQKYSDEDDGAVSTEEARRRAAARVVKEKVREDLIRDTGLEMVRWGTADVAGALPAVVRRIHGAWRRGDPRRFRGTLRSTPGLPLLTPDRSASPRTPDSAALGE